MRIALAAIAFLLVACGGGSVPVSGTIAPAPSLRTDLLFGYYFADSTVQAATAGHVNLHWASYEHGPTEQMVGLAQARASGQRVVLMLPVYDFPMDRRGAEVRLWLDRLRAAGLLAGIVALYPVDEPDLQDRSDLDVMETNAIVRRVAAEFPEIANAPLAVFYACTSGRRPGITTYDWIGCDDYDRGCAVLNDAVARLPLRPDQRLMLVAGGADPWRQDPACFERYAHAAPRVVALVAFLWQGIASGQGIGTNGLARLYCEAGRKITSGTANCEG